MIQDNSFNIDALPQGCKCKVFHAVDPTRAQRIFTSWKAKYKDKINVIGTYTYDDVWTGIIVIIFYQKINNRGKNKKVTDNIKIFLRSKVKRGKCDVSIG